MCAQRAEVQGVQKTMYKNNRDPKGEIDKGRVKAGSEGTMKMKRKWQKTASIVAQGTHRDGALHMARNAG